MTVDMMVNVMDNPAPGTVILITGDRDFAYAISILRMRRYRVVVIVPPNHHSSIRNQASIFLDWDADILSNTNVSIDDIPIHTPSVPANMSASLPVQDRDSVSESAVLFQGRSKRTLQHLLAESHALSTNDKGVALPACISFLSMPVSSIHTSDVTTVNSSTHDLRTEAVSPDTMSVLRLSAQLSAQTSLPPLFTNSAPPISISIAEELELVITSTYVTLRVLHLLYAFLNVLSLFYKSRTEHTPSVSVPASSLTNGPCSLPLTKGPMCINICPTTCISSLFVVLVDLLRELAGNAEQVLYSKIRSILVKRDPSVYERAGVKKFKQYIQLAVHAGVVIKGGKGTHCWLSLLPLS